MGEEKGSSERGSKLGARSDFVQVAFANHHHVIGTDEELAGKE